MEHRTMKVAVVVVMMEAVITVRRCRDRDVSRCDAIAAAQEESQENAQDSEPLDRILVEPPPEAQALPKILNPLTNPCPNPLGQRSRGRRNVGVLTVVEHGRLSPFLFLVLSNPSYESKVYFALGHENPGLITPILTML
jgi:hypothetical protein